MDSAIRPNNMDLSLLKQHAKQLSMDTIALQLTRRALDAQAHAASQLATPRIPNAINHVGLHRTLGEPNSHLNARLAWDASGLAFIPTPHDSRSLRCLAHLQCDEADEDRANRSTEPSDYPPLCLECTHLRVHATVRVKVAIDQALLCLGAPPALRTARHIHMAEVQIRVHGSTRWD